LQKTALQIGVFPVGRSLILTLIHAMKNLNLCLILLPESPEPRVFQYGHVKDSDIAAG
jgi:hypothetical protein